MVAWRLHRQSSVAYCLAACLIVCQLLAGLLSSSTSRQAVLEETEEAVLIQKDFSLKLRDREEEPVDLHMRQDVLRGIEALQGINPANKPSALTAEESHDFNMLRMILSTKVTFNYGELIALCTVAGAVLSIVACIVWYAAIRLPSEIRKAMVRK
eukprot:gnl/TRDRNA2_/TRDRNA2_89226_c0_seq1.p1 gnl/TRDRNA2_/TRDRNA2_89226_c0~~gnl/TRDRNA2_/TRDRNA2_89226_c0_seq1.p1  ORF type:complete len:155 (-),score=29.73 gnl/TRDRNA2_/TRDRNA2_89226_c0_seq1:49-513(-)